ncbi:two-component system regulatory protein YycI [Anaerobacillus sp. MEB173]|uniref:two-component system regulatory protein YycI n=1 Tax=Anaerobacillus sp. MEB173 TaxID=3383345 RepID=UPI003F930BD3
MDWSKTKTIFILTFFLLNSFLGYQFMEKKNSTNVSPLTEATLEERLKEMSVTVEVSIPDESVKGTHISGKLEAFLKENVENLSGQSARIVDEKMIVSQLDNPFLLSRTNTQYDLEQFLNEYILFGENYRFGGWNEETLQAGFYQTYAGITVYNYDGGQLIVQVDENNQIIGYQQRYLAIHRQGREQEMLSGLKAVEILFKENLIPYESHITQVELGYYSLFRPLGEVHVLAPMWSIRINDDHYLVNAIDSSIQHIN